MTLFGKFLVFIIFGLSVMIMGMAMMFYINRTDWTEGPDREHPGQLKARRDRVKDRWEAMMPAEASWRDNRTDVLAQEKYRSADRPWYAKELKHALTEAKAATPVREPVFKQGVLDVDVVSPGPPKHVRPKMAAAKDHLGRPLESLAANLDAELQKFAAIAAEQKKLQAAIEEDTKLTNLLTPPVGKGLLQRIEDEKVKIKRADEELAIIRPLLVNTTVEAELILRRREMLEARIKELNTALGVVSAPK